MSRYAIALSKPPYSRVATESFHALCFITFAMVQLTVMAIDLLVLGAIIVALFFYPSGISWGIALFALAQWVKSGAFQFWKIKNIKKFHRVMCTYE